MSHEYEVAIKLVAHNYISAEILKLIAQTSLLHSNFGKLTGGMKTFLAAGIAAGVAFEGFKVFKHFEEAGEKLVHVQTLFEAALPPMTRVKDMMAITAAAVKESGNNMQTTVAGNVEAMHDMYNVTQNLDESIKLLPGFNVMKNVLASTSGDKRGGLDNDRGIYSAIQALDLAGRTTAETIAPAVESVARTAVALGKRFDPGQLKTQVLNAGDARYGWDDEFLTKWLPGMMVTGLGNRSGFALQQANQNLWVGSGGALSSQLSLRAQEKYGIHTAKDEMLDDKGKLKGFKPGSMWEADVWAKNPGQWGNDFREHLKAQRIDINDKTKMREIVSEIGRTNRNFKVFLDEILLPIQNSQINREVHKNIEGVGPDAPKLLRENDPVAIHQALQAQWESANQLLGAKFVNPFLDNVYKPLTKLFSDIAQWAGAHPEQLAAYGRAFGDTIVSVSKAIFNAAKAAYAGYEEVSKVGGLMLSYAKTVDAALTSFRRVLVDSIAGLPKAIGDAITKFPALVSGAIGGISSIGQKLSDAILALPGQVYSAITTAMNAIATAFKNAVSAITGIGGGAPYTGRFTPGATFNPGGAQQLGPGPAPATPPPAAGQKVTILHNTYLDGRKLASSVTNEMVAASNYPRDIGGSDGRNQWQSPGAEAPALG